MDLAQVESDLLLGDDSRPSSSLENDFLSACCRVDLGKALSHDIARSLLEDTAATNVQSYLSGLDDRIARHADQIEALALGASLLRGYMQVNYTGPWLAPSIYAVIPARLDGTEVLSALDSDGCTPYALVQAAVLLLTAERVLSACKVDAGLQTLARWRLRAAYAHQKLLDEPSAALHDKIYDAESVEACRVYAATQGADALASWHLELAHIHTFYSQDTLARNELRNAEQASGVILRISGAMGRRTKFQTFDTSQLVVLAVSSRKTEDDDTAVANTANGDRPKIEHLNLNDDTLLERVAFAKRDPQVRPVVEASEELPAELQSLDPGAQPPLHLVDSCVLLSDAAIFRINSAADDEIALEQMGAFVSRVLQDIGSKGDEEPALKHARDWTIDSTALLLRTRAEGHRSRTVERSVMQLQVLVDQLVDGMSEQQSFIQRADNASTRNDASVAARLRHLFALPLHSKWDLQAELADKYVGLGLVKSALEIYERLQIWERVALCHGASGRDDLAKQVIEERIAAAEPQDNLPKLWCLLGDVTKEPSHYETSWRISNERFARAQRSLGKHHFDNGRLSEAIDCYRRSLAINPLNHGAWFILGCAALSLERWSEASEAFTRCVSIDNADGESWNNLASALLQSGRDRAKDAHRALRTATSLKFESWRMWHNYALVSMDVGQIAEAVRAAKRVLAIRGSQEGHLDRDLVLAVASDLTATEPPTSTTSDNADNDDEEVTSTSAPVLRGWAKMAYDFLTKDVKPLVTRDAGMYRCLARVYMWRGGRDGDALDCEERAYRCVAGLPAETSYTDLQTVTTAAIDLVAAYENLGDRPGRFGGVLMKDWRYKAKSTLRTLKGRARAFEGTEAYTTIEQALEALKQG
ncbi:hypothetical protein PYCC9005_003495 [Savitreella phatthalungensis]